MIKIPATFIKKDSTFIDSKGVPQQQHNYYVKWLRYYIDFYHKYSFPDRAPHSSSAFLEKLIDKKQAEHLRKQADHAITLFQAMMVDSTGNKPLIGNTKVDQLATPSQNISNKFIKLTQED